MTQPNRPTGHERYGMNMTQAEQNRVAWIVMAVLYALLPLPVGLLLVAYGTIGHGPVKAVLYGLAVLLGPVLFRHRIHRQFSPRRG